MSDLSDHAGMEEQGSAIGRPDENRPVSISDLTDLTRRLVSFQERLLTDLEARLHSADSLLGSVAASSSQLSELHAFSQRMAQRLEALAQSVGDVEGAISRVSSSLVDLNMKVDRIERGPSAPKAPQNLGHEPVRSRYLLSGNLIQLLAGVSAAIIAAFITIYLFSR